MLEGDNAESENGVNKKMNFGLKKQATKLHPCPILQLFGTDCMRNGFYDGIWVSIQQELQKIANKIMLYPMRFENEAKMIRFVR